jgi:hypothetical protein
MDDHNNAYGIALARKLHNTSELTFYIHNDNSNLFKVGTIQVRAKMAESMVNSQT